MNKRKLVYAGLAGLFLVCIGVLLLYAGALLQEPLLSPFDGVYPLDSNQGWKYTSDFPACTSTSTIAGDWPSSLPTPKGFAISPGDADFLFSSLLQNGPLFGYSATRFLYVDSESYYLVGTYPRYVWMCSYNAKRYGTRIHGTTGKVYDPVRQTWEYRGFVPVTRAEFRVAVPSGMLSERLTTLFGRPYRQDDRGASDAQSSSSQVWHYWTKDGEILVTVQGDHVVDVSIPTGMRV